MNDEVPGQINAQPATKNKVFDMCVYFVDHLQVWVGLHDGVF